MFTKNSNNKLKREMVWKTNLYSHCAGCGFKKFATIEEKVNSGLLNYKKILYYSLNCRKNTESKNPKVVKIKNGRLMVLLNCAIWGGKKFIKEQEVK